MSVRSFIALELSDEVKRLLGELLQDLRRTKAAVKWVEVENLHLTLKFLGDVPEEQIGDIVAALKVVAQEILPFSFKVCGVGGFPNLSRPRVLWIGVEPSENLMVLQKMVEQSMERLGFAPEGRDYHPHITLGRVKGMAGMEKVKAIFAENANKSFGIVSVNHMTLFRSDLSKEGPTYKPLAKLPFKTQ
ncbi:MAG: RNA 2',3'-cyclic phosphodiesterase [Armatimonadota bacterium]|nr:RNA 2',3'-cyclic phosphodiesterase [Armatimonadota bacterium]